MTQPQGLFITLEGIDGAGKSSHVDALEALFRATGREVVRTREPGGTPLAETLRGLVLGEAMDPLTESLLVFAARRDHVVNVIAPRRTNCFRRNRNKRSIETTQSSLIHGPERMFSRPDPRSSPDALRIISEKIGRQCGDRRADIPDCFVHVFASSARFHSSGNRLKDAWSRPNLPAITCLP